MTPDLEPRRHGPCAPPHAPGTAPVHGAHGSSSPLAVCFSPVCRRPPRGRGCQRPPLATSTCHPGTPRPPHHPRVPGIKCKRLERARERSVQAAQGEGSAGSEELQVFLPCPHSTRGTSAPRPRQPALVCGSVLYRKSTRAGPGRGLGDPREGGCSGAPWSPQLWDPKWGQPDVTTLSGSGSALSSVCFLCLGLSVVTHPSNVPFVTKRRFLQARAARRGRA